MDPNMPLFVMFIMFLYKLSVDTNHLYAVIILLIFNNIMIFNGF
jgi:hypothetical protein